MVNVLTLSQVDQLEAFCKEYHVCCPKHPGDNEYTRLQRLQSSIIKNMAAGNETQVLCKIAIELIKQRSWNQ